MLEFMRGGAPSTWSVFLSVFLFLAPAMMHIIPPEETLLFEGEDETQTVGARSQITWSGTQTLSSTYTVGIADELIIQACTSVEMSGGTRIIVDGRLTVLGTKACPVTFTASGTSDHEGIQFNSSSFGRGSLIQNLTIEDAIYGVTIYGSNPVIENLTVVNPDRVGVDIFSNASPRINDLYIDQAGRNLPFQGDWRYGIGLSIGAGSTPIIQRSVFTDILTRAVNIWGGSGGLIQGITVDNVTGSTWAIAAGIWVEDSQPLLTDITVDRSDTGIIIRHIDDGGYTHAVVRDATVTNSMYRGVYVDKNNHTNYTNYETADFTNLTIKGTGTSGAKTANIGFAALEVNATGAWFDNTLIEDSTTVGVRLYYVDSTTTFRNLTVRDSGDPGQGPHEAGIAVRSSYFAPIFEELEVSGSVGPGISSTSGGAMQGTDWHLHNNTGQGLYLNRATVVINGMELNDNGQSGAHVLDARYVTFENLSAEGNGGDPLVNTEASHQAGLYYEQSNDIESASGDVRCRSCIVSGSTGAGILAVDSVDLWLEDITLFDNNPATSPLEVDNSNPWPGGSQGRMHLLGANITSESPNIPAVLFKRMAGNVDGLTMLGNHSGLDWDGENNGNFPSSLSNSTLTGTDCLTLQNHPSLGGHGNTVDASCTGSLRLDNSQVNWSGFTDETGDRVIELDSLSSLHLHQPNGVDLTLASIIGSATIDVAWDLTIWVVNNNSNGIPNANVNTSFSDIEPSVQESTNDLGYVFLPDFIGQRWTSSGASSYNTVTIQCGYDSVSNTSTATLDQDRFVNCLLELDNQPPFLMWASPLHEAVYPSQGEVAFNASDSWDLDDDALTFSWSSNIDGDILSSCTGTWQFPNGPAQGFAFTANGNDTYACILSDGIHAITLEICDDAGHCVSEVRTIELVNQAPVLVVEFEPSLNPWSELIMPQTGTVTINTTGTYDPEGDDFACIITFSGYNRQGTGWGNAWVCPETLSYTFDHVDDDPPASFTLTVQAWDAVGNNATYSVPVILYNEIPEPTFTVNRESNFSEAMVTFDGSSTVDPEGDALSITYTSSLDGVLHQGTESSDPLLPLASVWDGYLSRGVHTITMEVTDNRAEHANQSKTTSMLLTVVNSPPKAVIETPGALIYDSSEIIAFSANGSGDYDAACDTFPQEGVWHCVDFTPSTGSEFLVVTWTSDLDGRLTPEGEDWLTFDQRLSAGIHEITLSLDDGINELVTTSVTVTVDASAPILGLVSPIDGSTHPSSNTVLFDATESVDFDGDTFTLTLRSSLETEPLLTDVDPATIHSLNLTAGEHLFTVTLEDETGLSRDEFFILTIEESAPVIRLVSPTNRQSLAPGEIVSLEEASYDADNDLVVRQWRRWSDDLSFPEVISTRSMDEFVNWAPGEYHLSLYIEDSRGEWVEEHVNITLQSSLPELDRESLTLSATTFNENELHELAISIRLIDADGTTQDVRANLTLNIQQWEVNLSDKNGDGVWEGVLDWRPESVGRPSLKIIARDGVGDDANIDLVSRSLVVEEAESDQRILIFTASVVATMGGAALVLFLIARRRRAMADLDLITSWDAFRAPAQAVKDADKVDVPELEQNIMDGTNEVQEELDQL